MAVGGIGQILLRDIVVQQPLHEKSVDGKKIKSYRGRGLEAGPVLDEALDARPVASEGCQVQRGAVVLRPVVHVGLKSNRFL